MSIFTKLFRRGQTVTAAQVLTELANRAMLMTPGALDAMILSAQAVPERTGWRDDDDWTPHGSKPEHLIDIVDGIGVLAVHGPLFQRWDVLAWWYGGTGYDVIRAAFDMLLADAGVREIVFDVRSNGGQVSGCFDLADYLASKRDVKPTTAIANDSAYSAAYAIAATARRVVVTRTAGTGSVGVIATHVDISKWEAGIGIAYTMVMAGEKKADYSPHAPLSERAHAELQTEIDRLWEMFIASVATNRGLDAEAVRATQAGCYFGPGAVAVGFADAIGTLEDVVAGRVEYPNVTDTSPDGDPPEDETEATAAVPASAAADDVLTLDLSADAETIAKQLEAVTAAIEKINVEADAAAAELGELAADVGPTAEQQAATFAAAVLAAPLPADIGMSLLKRGPKEQTPALAIAYAVSVRDACFAAGLESTAPNYIETNTDLPTVRAQLLAAKAAGGPEIVTTHPEKASAASVLSSDSVYESRRRAAAAPTVL